MSVTLAKTHKRYANLRDKIAKLDQGRSSDRFDISLRFNGKSNNRNAATYAAIEHFLKSVETSDTIDGASLNAGLRRDPVYFFGSNGHLRADGTLLLDMGLFRVKPPDEVTEPWDYYTHIRTIPAVDVFRIPARGACPLSP